VVLTFIEIQGYFEYVAILERVLWIMVATAILPSFAIGLP
jgi:hypothetical protein